MSITSPTDISGCILWLQGGTGMLNGVAGSPVSDGDYIGQWNDQGGAGNNCTQASASNRLRWQAATGIANNENQSGQRNNGIALPGGYPTNNRSMTFAFVFEAANVRRPVNDSALVDQPIFFQMASSVLTLYHEHDGILRIYDGSTITVSTLSFPTSRSLIVLSLGASSAVLRVNGQTQSFAALNGFASFGGAYGNSIPGGVARHGATRAAYGWNRQLTGGELDDLYNLTQATEGVVSSPTANVVVDGDSISYGSSGQLLSWPRQVTYPASCLIHNLAEPSIQLSTLATEAATMVDTRLQGGITNLLFVFAGTNDIHIGGASGSTVYSTTTTYCAARRTAGWGSGNKIAILGMLPRSNETQRQILRAALLADFNVATGQANVWAAGTGVTYADWYVDLGADAAIGVDGSQFSSTYYESDNIHPKNAGNTIIAGYASAVVNLAGLLASLTATPATAERGQSGQTTTLGGSGINLSMAVAGDFSLSHGTITGYNAATHVLTFTAWTTSGATTLTHTPTGTTATITVSDTAAPNSPTGVAAGTPTAYSVPLSFTLPAASPSGETVTATLTKNSTVVATGITSSPYTFTGVVAGDALKVKAVDDAGNASSNVSVTFAAPTGGGGSPRRPR